MTAVTFPLRPPRLAFAICGWRWQNDVYETIHKKYRVCEIVHPSLVLISLCLLTGA